MTHPGKVTMLTGSITDKTGAKYFVETCLSRGRERLEAYLHGHLERMRARPDLYRFLDVQTASISISESECSEDAWDGGFLQGIGLG